MIATVHNKAGLGIAFVLAGVFAISINDMLIKQLSGGYALHQIIFFRSLIGLMVLMIFVQAEGGLRTLHTGQPLIHLLRGVMVVISNMAFFLALSALPLADATALFFAAPLFITLLSVPILKERVGPLRLSAVFIGFIGVVIMQRPWASTGDLEVTRLVLLLPVFAALTYALTQLMTRKLGARASASALAVYIQLAFLIVSTGFFLVAGDGALLQADAGTSMTFLLRAWIWPAPQDWWVFVGLGCNGGLIGYCLSQAYRLADAATVAPFEYIGLPLAVFWGLMIFGDLPTWEVWLGIALILASGLFVYLRERSKGRVRQGVAARR